MGEAGIRRRLEAACRMEAMSRLRMNVRDNLWVLLLDQERFHSHQAAIMASRPIARLRAVLAAVGVAFAACLLVLSMAGCEPTCYEQSLVVPRYSLRPQPLVCNGGQQLAVDTKDGYLVVRCVCPKEGK